jgi:hypothetical protein
MSDRILKRDRIQQLQQQTVAFSGGRQYRTHH